VTLKTRTVGSHNTILRQDESNMYALDFRASVLHRRGV